MRVRVPRSVPMAGMLLACVASALPAQRTRFSAAYGPWLPSGDSTAQVFSAGIAQPLGGFVGLGLGLVHVADAPSVAQRTLTGGELTLRIGGQERGLYGVAGSGIGFRHDGGNPDAFWSVGGGFGLRLFSTVVLGVEGRYRVEDTGVGGFWRLDPADRKGFLAQVHLSFRVPGLGAGGAPSAAPPATRPASASVPLPGEPYDAARAGGASEEAARVTASVVESALAAMGAPYNWGGTDQNGFDCSGLIQYAYGQHGIVMPRVSRDQMRMGTAVDRRPDQLRPGDVLGFSSEGSSRITHVGLYVGNGQFIHSSSTGVKLSGLGAEDPDSRWWRDRWVGVRRIVE